MNDRKMQFRVGIVVLLTALIALILVMINSPLPIGWLPWGQRQYHLKIELAEAPGVGPGTPVHKNGLLVGRVVSVADMGDHVQITVGIDKSCKLYSNTECLLRVSVLGDATIEFTSRPLRPGEEPPRLLADGDVIQGKAQPNSMEAIAELGNDFAQAANSLQKAGDGRL